MWMKTPEGLPEGSVVLWVGTTDSTCGACGRGCLPNEESHVSKCGYDQHDGCGATYTHVVSTYPMKEAVEATKRLRPDLIYLGGSGL